MSNNTEQIGIGQFATHQSERIIFVEPNDVYDKDANNAQKGLSLTPKYEDFCISFNLIIEAFSRFKNSGTAFDKNGTADANNNKKTYSIEWGLTKDDMIKRRTSVLQGNRGKDTLTAPDGSFAYSDSDYNYLTTYYTDLTFDSYKEKTQIEGLGVESVQISYESWYTPTVTIKFVDVRGSALFGREEAIHIDERLTAENIFGAFFTQPYPLFRLQVKGFLGKPVTYHLTCSGFKGEFNSQTGNFEAVATFIGYSWSLLTDIPFIYLVAAPNASYIGMDYWERHKNTREWGLWDDNDATIPPPKLIDLFKWIKEADQRITDVTSAATSEQNENIQSIENEKKLLNDLNTNLNNFINGLKSQVDSNFLGPIYDADSKKQQLIIFSDSNSLKISADTIKKYDDMYETLQQYTTSYTGKDITTDKAPNKWTTCPKDLTFLEKFVVSADNEGHIQDIKVKELTSLTSDGLKSLKFNDNGGKLTHKMAEALYEAINAQQKNAHIKKYAYMIDLYDIFTLINDRLSAMTSEQQNIVKEVTEQINYHIKSILTFKPFIGNVFKIIFCHLETFCHIMFDSAQEIYDQIGRGERSPSFLKIQLDNTDMVKKVNENVTPWPAIYDNGAKTEDCGYVSENANVYGWVGDFSSNFIEEKVVYTLQEGIQNIVDNMSKEGETIKQNTFPVLPSDFIGDGSPFSFVGQSNISDLSAYLSIRAASNIGVMSGNNISVSMATTLGKLDAYNFYSTNSTIANIKNIMDDKTIADIKGISYCDPNFDKWAYGKEEGTDIKYHIFENVKKIREDYNNKGRKPMFKLQGNNNLFVHWYDDKQISYVSSSLKNFSNYKTDFDYVKNDEINPYFTPKLHERADGKIQSYDWLYNCDSTKLSVVKTEDRESYYNKFMFNVIDNDSLVNNIVQKHDQMKTGGCKIYDYEVKDDLKDYIDTFLKVGKDYKTKFHKNVHHMLSGNKEKLGIKDDDLLSDTFYGKSKTKYNFTYEGWNANRNKNLKNDVTFNDSGDLLLNGNNVTIDDLVIQQFKIIHFGNECNIFGCPFYYLQNSKKNNETDEQYKNRVLRVKALLFLHTFKYDYRATDLNVFSPLKKTGGLEIVPKGYLLFLGSMLWRKRYAAAHNGQDPIIYSMNEDSDKYKQPTIKNTLFVNETNGLFFRTIRTNNATINYNYSVKNLFGGIEEIDYNIENQLISLFENFVIKTFSNISSKYEIKNRVSNKKVEEYNSVTLKEDIVKVKQYFDLYDNKKKTSIEFEQWLRNFGIDNWDGKYSAINIDRDVDIRNQGLKLLFNEKDKQSQDLFKNLYVGCYIVCDSCHRIMGKSTANVLTTDQINVNNSLYDAYITGFINGCRDIINSNTNGTNSTSDTFVPDKLIKNRDLSVAIYYYLKNLWDKWLVISETNAFDVVNYFNNNFIFTDSFYRNTYHELAINCQKLLEAWTQLSDNGSLFHFLSRIVKDHTCIFLPVPDYVGFNGETQKHDIEMMEDLFRPLPYNAIEAPSNSNKFVIIYTYPANSNYESNGYKTDSYDIWSHTEGFTKTANNLFKITNAENFDRNKDTATREGYNVPSFGISFGRQNNHIFKNLKVTMDNPVMTEQAIKTLWEIAKKGSGGGRKINFIGQDTFNVFSNYSYSVTVEMMGNAQICPLMYFQLMNIPMWRGTYMIYKVVHNMTPGDMTTTVTAMKMSKFAKPFNSTFFVYNPYAKNDDNSGGTTSSCEQTTDSGTSTSVGVIDGTYGKSGMFTGKSRAEKMKMYGVGSYSLSPSEAKAKGLITNVTFNQTGGTKTLPMNKYIAEDFKAICNEILALGWFKLNVGNCYREKNSVSNGVSRHCWGIAVDINPGKGGNPWFATHIQRGQTEPAQGAQQPWPTKRTPYNGTYDRSKCMWHWKHPVVQIFLAHGWGWGGAYGDTMHFSVDDGH